MRLICPNCDAQYEVPDDVIPVEGRDVQCSNCGQTWFQHHADHMPEDAPEHPSNHDQAEAVDDTPAEDEERAPAPEPQRKELDPSVADILRQEAEQEARARASESAPLESQPDLGLDDASDDDEASRRAREARERMAKMRGEDPADAATDAAATAAAIGSRRDLLPDIEEINSTLRSTGDRQVAGNDTAPDAPVRKRKRRGFRRGFVMAALIVAVMALIYVYAGQISAAVPQLAAPLEAYVAWVDQMRVWLGSQVTGWLTWLDTQSASEG